MSQLVVKSSTSSDNDSGDNYKSCGRSALGLGVEQVVSASETDPHYFVNRFTILVFYTFANRCLLLKIVALVFDFNSCLFL